MSSHLATFGGHWKSQAEAKEAAKSLAAKGWEVSSIVQQHGEYKVRVSSYKEPQYIKEIKAGPGTPVQKARAIVASAKEEAKKFEIVEDQQGRPGMQKITVERQYRMVGAVPPPEKTVKYSYGAKDLTTGEETPPRKIVENVRVSAKRAREAGLISQREAEIGEREGREYYTSTQAIEASKTLKKTYGDRVKVSPGMAPAQAYYEYHQKREEVLDKLAKDPLTKTLYTVGPGFLGMGVVMSKIESMIVGQEHKYWLRDEETKIKRWLDVPLDYAPESMEFKRWAVGSGFSGGLAFVGAAGGMGALGEPVRSAVSSLWAAVTGLQVWRTIKDPSPRNIVRSALYVAPVVAHAGAKGIGRVIGHFRAKPAPVSHSVLKSEVYVHPGGKTATGKAHVLTRVGSGKRARYAASKIDSGMTLNKKLGIDEVHGFHRMITKSGGLTQRSIGITKDLGIAGKETSVSFHTGKIITRGRPSRIVMKKTPGGLAAVKPVKYYKPDVRQTAGAYGTRKISEVRYPDVKHRAGHPYKAVETHMTGGTMLSGKKGIITYRISQGTKGPEIAADVLFLGKTFENRFAGITRVYSLPKGAGAGGAGLPGTVLRSRTSGSLGSAVRTAKDQGAALARPQLAKDLSPKVSFKTVPAPFGPVAQPGLESMRIAAFPSALDVVVRSPAKLTLGPVPIQSIFLDQKRRVSPMIKTDQRVITKIKSDEAAGLAIVPMTPKLTALREHERIIPLIHTPQAQTPRIAQHQSQALLYSTRTKQKTKVGHPTPVSQIMLPSTFKPPTTVFLPPLGVGMELGEVMIKKKKKKRPWWAGMLIHPVKDPISAMGFDVFMKTRRKKK